MDPDRNLLFGVLALEAGLIGQPEFAEACAVWASCKETPLAEVLLQRGWIDAKDKGHLDYLVDRQLQKRGGDAKSRLAALPNHIKRSLASLDDADIMKSLGDLPVGGSSDVEETVVDLPQAEHRYELLRMHAQGGIGRVWLVRDTKLRRDVALKELRPERSDNEATRRRFLNEATITGRLEHPGIVPIYELATWRESQHPFYTMRFIDGRTLTEAASAYHEQRHRGQAEFHDFLDLLTAFVTVCNTISYAHSRGVVHRDLKGSNVVLGSFGDAVIIDWGFARVAGERGSPLKHDQSTVSGTASRNVQLTVEGQALGTPAYMAPEQAVGRLDRIGPLTDVYGLGAILYEILTGRPPFAAADVKTVIYKVRHEPPQPPRELCPEVPADLEGVCLRALSKEPADRHPSASALGKEVHGWQEVQRKRMEQAWRESEAFYQALVESLPQSILRKDVQGRFTYANQGACQLLGRTLQEIIGKTDFDLCPPDLADKYRRDDQFVLETGQALETTEELQTVGGPKRYVQIVKTPVHSRDGSPVGTQVILWDVTERKRLEEQLRQAREELRRLRDELRRLTASQ